MLESNAIWQFMQQDFDDCGEKTKNNLIKHDITYDLLRQRGLTTYDEVASFLTPSLEDLSSPEDLLMIEKATDRIRQAIRQQEKILIFGDYDADGICSTTLLLKVFHELGAKCDYYIPDRFKEGYGPNENAFKAAYEQGFKVIVTVDTGIASIHEAKIAKELGIDLIITDHHEIQEQLPEAYAIVNPKCSPDSFQDLAGVGVALKFAEYLLGYFPKHLLDLVAIGTIADLVPLVGDNRIFAHFGLLELTRTKNFGLQALKRICNIDGHVTEDNVGFLIGPRINAVGRISHAKLAVQLLMATNQEEASEIAKEIDLINTERQQIVQKIVREADKIVQSSPQQKIIIVAGENWNEGVLGIVASRLVKKYSKPVIVLTIDKDKSQLKGSARSIPAFNIFESCMEIRELFTHFGGHSQAAGMTFPLENFTQVQEKLNQIIERELTEEDFKQVIHINRSVQVSELNEDLFKEISRLAPFGMDNPKPVFHLKATPTDIRQLGQKKDHLKIQYTDENLFIEGIGFGMGELFPFISSNSNVSIVGEFGMNEWNGVKTPQIIIHDLAIDEWQLFDYRGKNDFELSLHANFFESNLIVKNEIQNNDINNQSEQITYESDLIMLTEVDALYICDLPPSLEQLQKIVAKTNPKNIYVCINLENSEFFKPIPTREDFKWFYSLLYKHRQIDLKKDLDNIAQLKGTTIENINFMIDVFSELNFIEKSNEHLTIHPNPVKTDLAQSKHYQKRLNKSKVEQVLYYSTYQSLREWFANCMTNVNTPNKEEVAHGL